MKRNIRLLFASPGEQRLQGFQSLVRRGWLVCPFIPQHADMAWS